MACQFSEREHWPISAGPEARRLLKIPEHIANAPRKTQLPKTMKTARNSVRPRQTGCIGVRDPSTGSVARGCDKAGAFALAEVLVAVTIVAIGFLGAFAMAVHTDKLASASEDEGLVPSALEQRIDQLRALSWPELTDGTGITAKVWTARPEPTTSMTITQETLTLSPWDVAAAKTLTAIWNGTASPTVSFDANAQPLSDASAVKVVATLTWTGHRTLRTQTRSLVTVISRGGISKSELP